MTAVAERSPAPAEEEHARKPLMSNKQILMMNAGFFGIQYSFGMQQTAINPIFTYIGADAHDLPLLNLAGPITGLLIQPLIGALSDRTWHPRWGRRKPFFLIGAIGCMICLFLFPLASALWMAVLLLWLLDASNNTAMEPYRAFLADKLPDNQLAKGFLTQSFFTGLGITLANLSVFVFQQFSTGATTAGIPYWVFVSFWLGAICSIASVLVTVLSTPENPPTQAELDELREKREKGNAIGDIASAVRDMPASLHKLGLVYMFQWYAIVIYWQFISLSLARSIFNAGPDDPGYDQAVGATGLANAMYNIVTFSTAFLLVGLARKYGAKWVHCGCLLLAAAAMWMLPQITTTWQLIVPMIGLGIAWASMMGVPYIMVVSMVPKERYGVYMGIINMMIVVPMIIQSLTFGWIYENLLGENPANALRFSGVLFALGALAMTWIRPPKRQSPVVPLTYRQIMGYGRVLVGSDGTNSSLRAVDRAAEIAAAAEAELIVATVYNPMSGREQATLSGMGAPGTAPRGSVRGQDSAQRVLDDTIGRINTTRVKLGPQLVLEGDPAQALVDAADLHGADLIVVGNRGLGAVEGSLLGSVTADIARTATCDVTIVQTPPSGQPEATGEATADNEVSRPTVGASTTQIHQEGVTQKLTE